MRVSKLWSPAFAVIAALLLFGCGGNGSSSGTTGTSTTGATGSTGGGGTKITSTQRAALFTKIYAKLQTLSSASPNFSSTMAEYIQTLPGILNASVEADNDVGVVFTDGEWLAIFNNSTPEQASADPYVDPPAARRSKVRAPTTIVPDTPNVFLVNYANQDPVDSTAIGKVQSMFGDKNYNNIQSTDASITNMAAVQNADYVFLSTHGGIVNIVNPADPTHKSVSTAYALLTNTVAPFTYNATTKTFSFEAANAPALDGGLIDGSIGFSFDNGQGPLRLCVTPKFISQYWSFNANSMMYNNVCESNSPNSGDYQGDAADKGLDTFLGWSLEVDTVFGLNVGEVIFEGLLGTHEYSPTRRRPFPLSGVKTYLASSGLLIDSQHKGAVLGFAGSGADFILAPSIRDVYAIDFNKQLIIDGYFGQDTGTVTVNGSSPGAVTWTPTQITCNGFTTNSSSANYAGPVVVTVHNHDSNTVLMSKYTATVQYLVTGGGSLQQSINSTFYFRGDVQPFRINMADSPDIPTVTFPSSQQSTCNYASSGSYTVGKDTASWSGSGSLKNTAYGAAASQGYSAILQFDYDQSEVHLQYSIVGQNDWTVKSTGLGSQTTTVAPADEAFTGTDPADYLLAPISTDFNINPVKISVPGITLPPPVGTVGKLTNNAKFAGNYLPVVSKGEDQSSS